MLLTSLMQAYLACSMNVQIIVPNHRVWRDNLENLRCIMIYTLASIPGAPRGGSIDQYIPRFIQRYPLRCHRRLQLVSPTSAKTTMLANSSMVILVTENQVSIGWASNWEYCNNVPTGPQEGWQSAMSLPRVNCLKNVSRLGWDPGF